jgi:Tfp pilus assembly protein PilO
MKAKQFFFVMIGLLGAVLLAGGAGYILASRMVQAQTADLRQRLAADVAADDQISSLQDLKKTYAKLKPLLPQIEAALPRSKQQSEIALQLQSLAGSSGMSLPNINFAPDGAAPAPTSQTVKSVGGASALPITFSLTGTYEQMQTFLLGLEQLNRYTNVSSLTINHKDEKAKTLSFSISINVYIKP